MIGQPGKPALPRNVKKGTGKGSERRKGRENVRSDDDGRGRRGSERRKKRENVNAREKGAISDLAAAGLQVEDDNVAGVQRGRLLKLLNSVELLSEGQTEKCETHAGTAPASLQIRCIALTSCIGYWLH